MTIRSEIKPVTMPTPTEGTAQMLTTTKDPLTSASISRDRAEENSSKNDRIVCYTTNWSVYRTGAARFIQNFIDPNLCTHIIYAYAIITENNTLEPSDPNSDITFSGYSTLNNLKKLNSNLRTLIGININNTLFTSLISVRENRQAFIESIVDFLKEHNFDGIDFVWKNTKLSDRNDFLKLIEEISERFNQESRMGFKLPLLLTIALPGKKKEIQGFDIARLNDYVDWFNVLTYNYHVATEPQVYHAAALYALPEQPLDELNVNFTVNEYLNAGAERNKLVLTIPTYGRTFTLANVLQKSFGAPAIGSGQGGLLTKLKGSLAYYEICDLLLKDPEWERYQPYPELVGPVVIKQDQWVSFDDENMMRTKADYVADNGLGGLAFWSIDQDDFRGICDGNQFALIRAAKNRLDEKLGIAGEISVIGMATTAQSTQIDSAVTMRSPSITAPTTISTTAMRSTTVTIETTTQINSNLNLVSNQGIPNPEENLGEKTNNRIVCYSTNWSFYRSGTARFIPNERNLNPNLCTHLNYFFAKIENDTITPLDDFVDIENNGYKTFTELKNKNPNLKTLISISEQANNEISSRFSFIAASSERRIRFIQNVLNFIKQYNFDGIDLVWMHPGDMRGTPDDKKNFGNLVEELRWAFHAEILLAGRLPYVITVAVPFDEQVINIGYDIPKLNEYVDWFNLLTYDYVLSSESIVNHHSPLYSYQGISSVGKNINSTVTKYIELGADRDKIVIGIPTYGRTFTLADSAMTNYGSPASGFGTPGRFTQLNNSLAFYEICQNINTDGWVVVQNQSELVGPYAYNDRQWVAYDDENMVIKKAEYVANMGLGGLMFWTVDQDDFVGSCTGKANLLISTAKDALYEKLSIGNIKPSENSVTIRTSSIRSNPEITTTTVTSIADSNLNAPPITNDQMTDLSIEVNDNFEETRNRIVCYVPNWSRYRASVAKFDASFILPDLCTHLIYAFANVINNSVVPSDSFADIDQMGYVNFNKIKSKNSQIKTLISINQNPKSNDSNYSAIVNDPERRQEFIENLLKFLKMNNFDGVDIDWQFPGENLTDKENFVQFLKEISAKFLEDAIVSTTPTFLLSITIPSEKRYLDRGYDIPKISDFVDWFNLLSYNYHKPTESNINHHAPLYSLKGIDESENNVNASVFNYIESGIERSKLVVGIPTYGVSYTLANESLTGINSPAAGPGIKGELSGAEGSLAFYEICQKISNDPESEWNVVQVEPRVMGPYAFKGTRWIAFDDEEMVRTKAEYVADNGLGGLMFWSIDQDDFRGLCGDREPNALIQTGKRALLSKLSFSPSNPVSSDVVSSSDLAIGSVTVQPDASTSTSSTSNFTCSGVGLFPNPKDCTTYYACVDLYGYKENLGIEAILLPCGNGAYFNSKSGDCTFLDSEDYCTEQNKYGDELTSSASTRGNSPVTENVVFTSKDPIIVESSSFPSATVPIMTVTSSLSNSMISTVIEPTNSPVQENSNINRLLKLIESFGGFEKFEQRLKYLSPSSSDSDKIPTVTSPSLSKGVSLPNSKPTVVTNTENKKFTLKTQFKVNDKSNGVIQSQFEIPKTDSNNANKLVPHSDNIYQIKELHIHNYGQPIIDERSANDILKQSISHNTQDQPLIVFAPVQVINKAYS